MYRKHTDDLGISNKYILKQIPRNTLDIMHFEIFIVKNKRKSIPSPEGVHFFSLC